MTTIEIPKGYTIIDGTVKGIANENINVEFEAEADEVAACFVQTNNRELLPQLEHEITNDKDDRFRVCYTRQGNRLEIPIVPETEEPAKAKAKK